MGDAALTDTKPELLVVDDSRVVRRTIVKHLAPSFKLIEAENGVAGWRILNQSSRIELIITDIQMPEMDGYTFICKVRAAEDPELRDLPVIVITGAEDEITRERAYACGANDFVLKPFNTKQLFSCVRSQLTNHQESSQTAEEQTPPPSDPDGEMILPNENEISLNTAVTHIDAGIKMLASLSAATVAPQALRLTLRFMPILKFCNVKFKLGMDNEITTFQQRVTAAYKALKRSREGH